MADEIEKIERGAKTKKVLSAVARSYRWCQSNHLPFDGKTLIEWDGKINHKRLLDYSRERNYRAGLLLQARVFIEVYTRQRLPGVGDRPGVSIAKFIGTDEGYLREEDMTDSQREIMIESFLEWLGNKWVRIRVFASRWRLRKATNQRIDRAEREFRQLAKK